MKLKEKKDKAKKLVKRFFKGFFRIASQPQMRVLPGNVAYFMVLSFAPILTLITLIASNFSISLISYIEEFQNVIPKDIVPIITNFLNATSGKAGGLTISLVIGFIIASNGAHSLIITSNNLYGIKSGNIVGRRMKSIFLTLVLIFLCTFILVFLVFGNFLINWILSFEAFIKIKSIVLNYYMFLKWPIMILVIYFLIKMLYTLAPDAKVGSKNVTLGAMFTTIGWIIATLGYTYYANNIADYNLYYSGISNLIILMVWIYFISYILVMGIAINVSHYGLTNIENKKDIE